MNLENKITELEIHFAHQEQTIQTLNKIILEQQKTIENLHLRLSKMESEISDISYPEDKSSPEDQPPPHY